MKKRRSWRQILFSLLACTLVLLMGFLLVVNLHFYRQASETVRQSNTQILQVRAQEVTARLNTMREHVREMLYTVNNESELKTGSEMMQFNARVACYTSMENKIAASSDLDNLYILDTDTGSLLLAASSRQPNQTRAAVMQFLKERGVEATDLRNEDWQVVRIGGQAFFSKAYRLGKYIVGGFSSTENFDAALTGEISGEDTGYLLLRDGGVLHTGGYDWSGRVQRGENGYTVPERGVSTCVYEIELAGCQVVLVTRENALQSIWTSTTLSLTVISALFLLLFGALMLALTKLVSHPTQQLLVATQRLEAGDLSYRIQEEPVSSEFYQLRGSFNAMADQIVHLKIAEYEQQLVEKESELKLLRAQIRPHFFLNAITTVLSMTYQDRGDDIRRYLTALSGFMRYMLQLQQKTVRVGDELINVRNYLDMQKIRFPDSVACFVGCEPQLEDARVPYLLLFTVVENSFKHAMDLYHTLSILIQCERFSAPGFRGLRIIVEDNGGGFPQEVLRQYQTGSGIRPLDGHIGLSNVYRTLQLVYGRDDLLHISNVSPHGARVEVWIPREEEETP